MQIVKKITRDTLANLKEKDLPTTLENYFLEFVTLAKSHNIKLDEIKTIDDALENLTNEEKNLLNSQSIFQIIKVLLQRTTNEELKALIYALGTILVPSINFNKKEIIEDFILKCLRNPKNIVSEESILKIREFAQEKVEEDRKVLREQTNDIIKLTALISRFYDRKLSDSNKSDKEINEIKKDLIKLDIPNHSNKELMVIQKKLIDTIEKFENSLLENTKLLSTNVDKFKFLHKQMEELEKELKTAKKEYFIDFLTGISNRRAYDSEAKKIEKQFFVFDTNFAIVFFDLDHFKNINDDFGHICGDEILKSFAAILKDLTRKEDIVARYGGEEFIALINFRDKIEVDRYIKRVKKTVLNSTFIYKEHKINITFSAGITFRKNYKSIEEAQIKADKLLYQAKKTARNKAVFDTGDIL